MRVPNLKKLAKSEATKRVKRATIKAVKAGAKAFREELKP